MKKEKISFTLDDGSETEFYVEEQTVLAGRSYLLVSDAPEGEANAYILKDVSEAGEATADYRMVEDEEELSLLAEVFGELLDDDVELD